MAKKDEVEKELRHSLDKIRDLRDIIEELEKQLDLKSRVESELRQKLSNICESLPNSSLSDSTESPKNAPQSGASIEHLDNLKEQIASQSQEIELMSQSQSMLHELRGQIHFLEAKVEQRARQLESSFLSATSSPIQSGDTSPSGSQGSESLQIPCEDGWEMSPRSIHWLEIRRLEEKIGRLAHIDEELLKKNKELEQQLKKIKASYSECQQDNTSLQEKLSEQLVQISALKSHMEEQKHRCSTPQKTHSFSAKIEELREELEKQTENNKRLISDFQEAQSTVKALQDEIRKKEEMVATLQNCIEARNNLSLSDKDSSKFSTIEDLRQQLSEKTEAVDTAEKQMKELRSDIECLKAENKSLKCLLEKAENEAESERAKVEALIDEMSNLAENNKKLEQDFNTVQDMMQQKERELDTLQEETDAQMKLEAEIESLERKLSDQRIIESEMREEMERLESELKSYKHLKDESETQDLAVKNLKETHMKEIEKLQMQIEMLKKFSAPNENDEDIEKLVDRILEAAEAFKPHENNHEFFHEVLLNLLRNSIDSIVKQLRQNHEENITSLNKSWEEKIKEEIASKERSFWSERHSLLSSFCIDKEKTNAFWQEKVKVVETQLKKEQIKYKKLSDSAKTSREEMQAKFNGEMSSIQQNFEIVLKEKISLKNTVKDLKNEIDSMKQSVNDQKNVFAKEYETKLTAISKTIKESFESEKQKIIASYQQRIDQLQRELDTKLELEKSTELKHKEELTAIYKYFDTRWADEMKKVKDFQSEDLKKLKNVNEKMLEDRLKNAKDEFASLIAEERKQILQKHKQEVEHMRQKFEEERKLLLEMKEKAVKEATDLLEKKFNENLTKIQQNLASSGNAKLFEQSQIKWEEEKLKLISLHRKEISTLKQELKSKYEKQLQDQSAALNAEIKRLDEIYNKKVEEVRDLVKETSQAASRLGYSDVGSNRTTTPSSEMTSSDEACSSCQEDMLSVNKHILVDKIHQDGKRVLSLIESSAQPFASVKEAHLWLEERKWIINKLKIITPIASNVNLKIVISDLVDEIQKFRKNFEAALDENSELRQKYDDLEQQSNMQYSKLCDVNMQLKRQIASNSELELLLSDKTSELSDLKRRLAELSRLAEKETYTPISGSTASSGSYEIGVMRSADQTKSAEKFSLFLPEIGNSLSLEPRTPKNKISHTQEMQMPLFNTPPVITSQNSTPSGVMEASRNQMHEVKEKLMSVLDKSTTDIQIHGLYWAYRRSQSYNKALIYQKKYLLMLLRGFQVTENVTLAWLKHMNTDKSTSLESDSKNDPPLRPRSRFRALGFVIIAVQRMKFYVRRWQLLAKIPPSQVINAEIQSVFQSYSFLSPGDHHLSTNSLASVPLSFTDRDFRNIYSLTSSRAENKSKNSTNIDKSQLIEYVHRIDVLQKQLGLDSLR